MADDTQVEQEEVKPILTIFGQVMDDGSIRVGNNLAKDYNMHQSMFEALSIGVATQLLTTLNENYSPLLTPLAREMVLSLRKNFPEDEKENKEEEVPEVVRDAVDVLAQKTKPVVKTEEDVPDTRQATPVSPAV